MYLVELQRLDDALPERRKSRRCILQCRARILIGKRHYAGYIHNISPTGAKLRTITLIRKLGTVILKLPDLPPIRCHLRWNDGYNAGVEFAEPLAQREFTKWSGARLQPRQSTEASLPLVADLVESPVQAVGT